MSTPSMRERWIERRKAWRRLRVEVCLFREWAYLWRVTRQGYPIESGRVDLSWHDPEQCLGTIEVAVCEMLEKRASRSGENVASGSLSDPQSQQRWPTLWHHLTQKTWPDQSARQTSSILVFEQEGQLKAMLRDKEAGECLWVAAKSLVGLFDAVEGALNDPEPDWRPDRKGPGDSAPRRKK